MTASVVVVAVVATFVAAVVATLVLLGTAVNVIVKLGIMQIAPTAYFRAAQR